MPTLQVNIDGESRELDFGEVELPEGYDLVSPDNASSKGYFTQAQLNAKVKEINKSKVSKAKKDLSDDQDFHREIFENYGIELDDDGNPTGLKPEVDIDQVKQNLSSKLSEKYEKQLSEKENQASTLKNRLIEQSILSATKGLWKDDFTSHHDNGRVKPIVVKQFGDLFDVDENGNIALKDSSGEGFEMGPKGQHISPEDYLNNQEKFGGYMKDKRQGASGYQGSGQHKGKRTYTQNEIKNMSDAEYEKNREDILKAQSEGRVQ